MFYFCGNVLSMYSFIWIALGLFILTVTVIRGHGCYLASSVIHETLLFNILRSPAYFFDITPTGRIINRFAKDMDTVDLMVIFNMTRTANFSMEALCTASLIVYSTPMVVVAMVPLAIIYYLIQVQTVSPCIHRIHKIYWTLYIKPKGLTTWQIY